MVTYITRLMHRSLFVILLAMYSDALLSAPKTVNVTVMVSSASKMYEKAVSGVKTDLSQSADYNFNINVKNLSQDTIDSLVGLRADYIITIGSRATAEVIRRQPRVPVLSIMVAKQSYHSIRAAIKVAKPEQYSVIYLDQPAVRTFALAKIIIGKKLVNIGMLFGPTSKSKRKQYLTAAESFSMSPVEDIDGTGENSIEKIKLILDSSDVYVAIYDRKALNRKTAKWLLYLANLRRKPVIGYSSAYVDAGALAAIYTKPLDIGHNAAKWVQLNLKNKNTERWDTYPKLFTVNVNRKIARRLNLSIASETALISKIRQIESQYE